MGSVIEGEKTRVSSHLKGKVWLRAVNSFFSTFIRAERSFVLKEEERTAPRTSFGWSFQLTIFFFNHKCIAAGHCTSHYTSKLLIFWAVTLLRGIRKATLSRNSGNSQSDFDVESTFGNGVSLLKSWVSRTLWTHPVSTFTVTKRLIHCLLFYWLQTSNYISKKLTL